MISAITNTCKKHLHLQSITTVLIVLYLTASTVEQQLRYGPVDDIAIDCGFSGNNTSLDPRSWIGDINSKYFSQSEDRNKDSVTLEASEQQIAEVDTVPYRTARLSHSEFTYKIPVTPGPKFIRLYFFSASYGDFNRTTAYFSVKVGRYSLLNNFSVSLTADALGSGAIKREFCVTAEQSSLNMTFTPSSLISGAFAFVNGIEVVSMPSNLYYSEAGDNEIRLLELSDFFNLENSTALETMYRINIGGNAISPLYDTGMFRQWDKEDDYLTVEGVSALPVLATSTDLKFRDNLSSYAAPADVYKTARSTGDVRKEKNLVRSYNLTWEFPVDSGFGYLLRLHFCEIEPLFSKIGDRVFPFFIANKTAEYNFDVVLHSGGQYKPYFRDYVDLKFGEGGRKKINLSVALHPNPIDANTGYVDAILNGLEIFKLSDTMGNLAGPNPDPSSRATNVPPLPQQRNEKKNRTAIIAIVSGVVSGAILLLFVLGYFILRRARKVKDAGSSWWGPISFATTKSSKTQGSSSLPSDLCRYFSLAEINAATKDFNDTFIIGVGGFGNVYKGYIDDGTTPVAIKRLKSDSSQGAHEFKTEIEMLSHLRHRHLVSLIGYCNEDREMILVYDYMARGTFRSHLYGTENPPISWKQRLEICIGAARGLHYLHTGAKCTIIHRDVKTTNILLDEKWLAKVSDFGLSKTGPTSMFKAHVSTVVKGSFGYLDPEYYRRQQLTEKSDVYSFGVVLCEVLCGRPPILRNAERKQVSLAEWVRSCFQNGMLNQIVDLHLTGQIAPECLKKYGDIAVSCMVDNGTERPSMNDIVWGLEFAMQLQKNAEDNDRIGGAIMEDKGMDEVALMKSSNNSDVTFSSSWENMSGLKISGMSKMSSSELGSTTNESIKGTSGTVFSEINDPKGR